MSEWKECTMRDLLVLHDKKRIPLSSIEREKRKGPYPYYGATCIFGYVDDYLFDGDYILLGEDGTVVTPKGKPVLQRVSGKIWVNNHAHVITGSNNVDFRFLYYLLSNTNVSSIVTGAVQPKISQGNLLTVRVSIPSLPTQRKISAVLGALDDKIELNRKMNANLEAMAQALFKSWFVDFEPFGRKMPEGWRVGTFGEIVKVMETGSRPKGGALQDGIPSIGAENVEGLGLYNYASDKYVSQEFFDRLKRGKVASGDVLLYKDGAYTGKVSMALDGFPHKVAAVNEHVFILRTEECKYQSYLYCLLKRSDMYKTINTLASSKAAQPGLNQTELSSVEIVVPSEDMIAAFEGIIFSLLHKMAANANQSRTLAQLRDALLPKLMSGELDVEAVQVEA